MRITRLILALLGVFLIISCEDDDGLTVDTTPVFESIEKEIHSLPGETFLLEATIADPNGIESINIKCDEWYLDKTILKNDSIYERYNLSYAFLVPADELVGSKRTVTIAAKNRGGVEASEAVTITLDKDIKSPALIVNQPINASTILLSSDNQIRVNITTTDEALAEFYITGELVDERFEIEGTTYTYSKNFEVNTEGKYTFNVTVTDLAGNSTNNTFYVNVREELAFDNMYITGVDTEAGLTSGVFGMAFATEPSTLANEKGKVFTTQYYSPQANTTVRFIPQRDSFSPFSFGANESELGKLAFQEDGIVNPIILPNVGYYEISISLTDMSYSLSEITPTDASYSQIYIIGTGIDVGETSTCIDNTTGAEACWTFKSSKPLVKDPNNPYLWTLDIYPHNVASGATVGFILNANPNGWSPFWRFNATDWSQAISGGGTNYAFEDEGYLNQNYTLVFDTYLSRVSLLTKEQ